MRTLSLLAASAVTALALSAGASAQEATTGAELALPPVVAAWAEAWNTADAEAMAALFAPDGVYEDWAFQAEFRGPEGAALWVELTAAAIPDARMEVLDAFREGDRIAVRWTFTGTPIRFADIPSTGESFSVPVVSVIETDGGRIARVQDAYNLADLFRQVGVDPSLWVPPAP